MLGLLFVFLIDASMHHRSDHSHAKDGASIPLTSESRGSLSTDSSHGVDHGSSTAPKKNPHLNVLLLEISILSHSIFVGLSISLTIQSLWPLVIAFTFHQVFEGLALGVRIAELLPPRTASFRARAYPWLLVCGFALTAPFGQAIGLGVHTKMVGEVGTIVGAVVNGISAGMLIYTALVDLVAVDFFGEQELARKKWAVTLVVFGSISMAVVAAFA